MMRWRSMAAVAAGLLVVPSAALAHLVNSGLGPFYDGGLHLLLSPGDLLGLVALALLAGLRGPAAGRLMVMTLPVAWYLSGLAGLGAPSMVQFPWMSVLSFAILGALVAADLKLAPLTVAVLAGAYGTLHGLFNGAALAATGAGPMALFGIAATVLVIALLVSAAVVPLKAAWTRIAVRVAGSWVAAVGMLMLGWIAKGVG